MTEARATAPSHLVGTEDLERHLERLELEVSDGGAGLFGPSSKLWEINGEALVFVGAGRAALLQLAHPAVAQAIDDHSTTRTDPMGRFRRTFTNVFAMVFGDLDSAFDSARSVHRVHQQIVGTFDQDCGEYRRGQGYWANDPESLLWVHSTLWETSITLYEAIARPLSCEEKDRYYDETRRFAHLFGIDDDRLPDDWADFESYNRTMWEQLVVSEAARDMGRFLFRPPNVLMTPALRWLRTMTAGLMPPRLRDQFGMRFTSRDRRAFERRLAILRRTRRWWPYRLRYLPPYVAAQRRLAGKTRRDYLGEALQILWLGRPSRPATR